MRASKPLHTCGVWKVFPSQRKTEKSLPLLLWRAGKFKSGFIPKKSKNDLISSGSHDLIWPCEAANFMSRGGYCSHLLAQKISDHEVGRGPRSSQLRKMVLHQWMRLVQKCGTTNHYIVGVPFKVPIKAVILCIYNFIAPSLPLSAQKGKAHTEARHTGCVWEKSLLPFLCSNIFGTDDSWSPAAIKSKIMVSFLKKPTWCNAKLWLK